MCNQAYYEFIHSDDSAETRPALKQCTFGPLLFDC